MELFSRSMIFVTVIELVIIINLQIQLAGGLVGVNLGLVGDNLPSASEMIIQCKAQGIPLLRIMEPNLDILHALRGTSFKVAIGVRNENVTNIAMNQNTAMQWVNTNVVPYINEVNIGWIVVGNEIIPSNPNANLVTQAINNIFGGLYSAGLTHIKVSTVVNVSALRVSSPPSAGRFSNEASNVMKVLVPLLTYTKSPLMINVYPYFAYVSRPYNVTLDFALFKAKQPVIDGPYKYHSLFEAMVDAFYAALDNVLFGGNVSVVVAATGWPTDGNAPYTSLQNAQTYNQNLIDKMKRCGTPRRSPRILDIFIYAMYDEDKKPIGVDRNWGIHYANKSRVYPLIFGDY